MGYFLIHGSRIAITDPYKAISTEAYIVIETPDIRLFLDHAANGNGLALEFSKIAGLENYNTKLKFLATKLKESSFNGLLAGKHSVMSFFSSPNGPSGILFSMAVSGNIRLKHIKQMLLSSGLKGFTEGHGILSIPFTAGSRSDTCFISVETGLFLLSDSRNILLRAIDQVGKENDIKSLHEFSAVYKASGKNETKIFLVFANLKSYLRKSFLPGNRHLAERFGKIAAVTGGDIYIDEDGLTLNGYTESTDSNNYLFKYRSIPPHELSTYKILPARTGFFITCAITKKTAAKSINHPISMQTQELAESIREFMGDEITKAYIDLPGQSVQENTLTVYKLDNVSLAKAKFLEKLPDTLSVKWFQPDEQIKIPVFRTPFPDLINAFMPGFEDITADSCFAFYDNYLVTGRSYNTITDLLYDNLLNNTLANDDAYSDFMNTQPGNASFCFFCKPSRISSLQKQNLDTGLVRLLEHNILSLRKIRSAGFQLSPRNDMLYSSVSIRFSEEPVNDLPSEWKTLLDTAAAIKPFFFTDHVSGAKEIFIQDLNNNAYLVNSSGRILWKVPLNERLSGDVYSIDFYKNGKAQLFCAGRNFLHVIDRNGNYLERFPLKLRVSSITSPSLFDYENTRNYRVLISGEDKKIYAFDKSGSLVNGWYPFNTMGSVMWKIEHCIVSGRDYIIAADEKSIYLLDRSGKSRVNLKEPAIRAKGSSLRLVHDPEPHLVCSSPDGSVQQIFFDGTVSKFKMREFSPDHSFDVADINSDGSEEYIFTDKGILYLYNKDRSELVARDYGKGIISPYILDISASEKRIGLFDKENNLIYLLDKNGETMKGFPVTGTMMLSSGNLTGDGKWNLIVGGDDRFLYNYKIEN